MTLKQSYEMDFQHCYKLWRVLNGREGMSLNTERPVYSKTTTRTIFDLKYFSRNRKKKTPRKASFYFFFFFFTRKVCTVIFVAGGYVLSQLQNDKTYNI